MKIDKEGKSDDDDIEGDFDRLFVSSPVHLYDDIRALYFFSDTLMWRHKVWMTPERML